jgi:GNAT superfamily N-acetyltransferase
MDFEVRPVEESDAPELTALLRGLGIFSRLESEDSVVTTVRVLDHLQMCLADDSHTVRVATDSAGTLIGYVAVHWLPYLFLSGPEGYVSELFVDETCRGHGVGSALIDAIVAEARRRCCARLTLEAVTTRESYRREFYPKRGWIERKDMASFVYEL